MSLPLCAHLRQPAPPALRGLRRRCPRLGRRLQHRPLRAIGHRRLGRSRRCRLVVLGIEVGGRWSDEALTFIGQLARAKARTYPRLLQASAQMAFTSRWVGLLSVAAHGALASTLLELPVEESAADGEAPLLEDVLHSARLVEVPVPSRLPLR